MDSTKTVEEALTQAIDAIHDNAFGQRYLRRMMELYGADYTIGFINRTRTDIEASQIIGNNRAWVLNLYVGFKPQEKALLDKVCGTHYHNRRELLKLCVAGASIIAAGSALTADAIQRYHAAEKHAAPADQRASEKNEAVLQGALGVTTIGTSLHQNSTTNNY